MSGQRQTSFKARLRGRERLLGTFLRTPSPITCEVLSRAHFDVICVDAEHAPFGPAEIDACVHALRAGDMPSLVRIPEVTPGQVLQALDCGATGLVVPHVTSGAAAQSMAKAAFFGRSGRGFAGSTRAGDYSHKSLADHLAHSRAHIALVAQIEDVEALDHLDAIAAVDAIDCLFVGRMDLTVSLNAPSPHDPAVMAAVQRVCDVGRARHKTVGMFLPRLDEVGHWVRQGASFFLLASDQALLLSGAHQLAADFAAAVSAA
jgi:2-keto-3-deoxy-L-rhamnonate aldolase RhmA